MTPNYLWSIYSEFPKAEQGIQKLFWPCSTRTRISLTVLFIWLFRYFHMKVDSSRFDYIIYSLFNSTPTNSCDFSNPHHCCYQLLFSKWTLPNLGFHGPTRALSYISPHMIILSHSSGWSFAQHFHSNIVTSWNHLYIHKYEWSNAILHFYKPFSHGCTLIHFIKYSKDNNG